MISFLPTWLASQFKLGSSRCLFMNHLFGFVHLYLRKLAGEADLGFRVFDQDRYQPYPQANDHVDMLVRGAP